MVSTRTRARALEEGAEALRDVHVHRMLAFGATYSAWQPSEK